SKLIHGPQVDPGWNVDVAEAAIKWVDQEAQILMGTTWPEIWSPEKMAERVKGDGGLYASDAVPTINCWDFYFWNDNDNVQGWNRRMVLDAYQPPGIGGVTPNSVPSRRRNSKGEELSSDKFIYNPGNRKYGSRLSELVTWQFADLSAVGPFRYHSVRGLGWLLYAVCHLQNRLRCKFSEASFETLMMYMRVDSLDDAERALKVELISRGIIDNTVKFIPQNERWNPNQALAEGGLLQNAQIIQENASSYRPSQNYSDPGNVEKTKFQVMTELNTQTALISSGLLQAYRYQKSEFIEIFRRFCKKNSRDHEVREFRNNCLRGGVPEKILVPEAWEIEPEQVLGAGNKTLEMATTQLLMQYRNLYDPSAQRRILRDVTLAITDDPARADDLVPNEPSTSYATDDAQRAAAVLLAGLPMAFKEGVAHDEYATALLNSMQHEIGKIKAMQNNMATPDQIVGLLAIAGEDIEGNPVGGKNGNGVAQHLIKLSEDPESRQTVKQMRDVLGKALNEVKGFAQRIQEQRKAVAEQNGQAGMSPESLAKVEELKLTAETKRESARQSHGMKVAQKQVAFDQKMREQQDQHRMDMERQAAEVQADIAAKAAQTAAEIARQEAKPKESSTAE